MITENIAKRLLVWLAPLVRRTARRVPFMKVCPSRVQAFYGLHDLALQTRLEIGSGTNPLPGYFHVDRYAHSRHLDARWDARRLRVPNDSVDDIVAVGVIEHFAPAECITVLREWHRALSPTGIVKVFVPNGTAIAQAWLRSGTRDRWALSAAIYGGGDAAVSGPTMVTHSEHHVLYDFNMLRESFLLAGFKRIEDVTHEELDRHTEGWSSILPDLMIAIRAAKT